MILAIGAAAVGGYFEWTHGFSRFLEAAPPLAYLKHNAPLSLDATVSETSHVGVAILSTILVLFGMVFAAVFYLGNRKKAEWLAKAMDFFGLYSLAHGKFFIDPLYRLAVVLPMLAVARLAAWFDHTVVDGIVDVSGASPRTLGSLLRPVQNGLIPFYALAMVFGLLILLGALLM
jgi:NADH-quinone oxidoreductase subunit L